MLLHIINMLKIYRSVTELLKKKKPYFIFQFAIKVCTGQTFQAQPKVKIKISDKTQPSPKEKVKFLLARLEREIETSARARPGHFFFPDFGPYYLGLSDFKTSPFSCFAHNKHIFCS